MKELNENLAELYGAMIGDGCLSRYLSNYEKREIFCTLITGHTHDEPYYREILRPIILREFKINGCIRFRKKYNCTRFETTNKQIFGFFKNLGFPIGLKNDLSIPNAIQLDNKLSIACLRGIFNTDGPIYSRYSKKYENHAKHYNHLVVQFKMKSHRVIEQIKIILEYNEIKTTKVGKIKDVYYVVRITDQKNICKFMELIKSNHKYHTERYLKCLKSRGITGP